MRRHPIEVVAAGSCCVNGAAGSSASGVIGMKRRFLAQMVGSVAVGLMLSGACLAQSADETPDALIKRVSSDVLETIKADKSIQTGETAKVVALVESKVIPHVNFERMTASAVGPAWRQATPEQKKRLQDEFKALLVRTYSGALAQVTDQTITLKPFRSSPDDKEVIVRTEIKGHGDPIQLDYRLEKSSGSAWKIYNLNVLGVWLVETYRSQFAQEINAKGIDGLITALSERNKANAKKG